MPISQEAIFDQTDSERLLSLSLSLLLVGSEEMDYTAGEWVFVGLVYYLATFSAPDSRAL